MMRGHSSVPFKRVFQHGSALMSHLADLHSGEWTLYAFPEKPDRYKRALDCLTFSILEVLYHSHQRIGGKTAVVT